MRFTKMMDARIKSGHDREEEAAPPLLQCRGRGLTVASRHANRTTDL
jgi:hypothetical protein